MEGCLRFRRGGACQNAAAAPVAVSCGVSHHVRVRKLKLFPLLAAVLFTVEGIFGGTDYHTVGVNISLIGQLYRLKFERRNGAELNNTQ